MAAKYKKISGGVCGVRGITAAGLHCGLKQGGEPDLALVVSERPAKTAAFYTTNLLQGAHIEVFRRRLAISKGSSSALLVNSRIANCSTGRRGVRDSSMICDRLAQELGLSAELALHASTGVIGKELPVEKIFEALPELCQALSADGGDDAARAIMTTDAAPKSACIQVGPARDSYRIGGMAKGAGMIQPNMATMLAFVYTDADIPVATLRSAARRAMDRTFNRISVDNDMSPNDTFAVMANGLSGVKVGGAAGRPLKEFEAALEHVCMILAKDMIRYGEGVTRLVEINITGARNAAEADLMAKAIANSNLVTTAVFGGDPNWGRILSAAASCGAHINPDRARLCIDGALVYDRGRPCPTRKKIMQGREVTIELNAAAGRAGTTRWTGDLSVDYVKINAEYTT